MLEQQLTCGGGLERRVDRIGGPITGAGMPRA